MTKIIFLCNWGESPEQLLNRYRTQTPNNSGVWGGGLFGVCDIKKADYYIVLEGYNIKLPDDKTIYIKREPNFIKQDKQNYTHNISWEETNCGVTWWVNKTYDELKHMEYGEKIKDVSCVVSSKHSHRNNYVKSLFKSENPIELYGRGHDIKYYGNSYKGELNYNGKCKFRGLKEYKYSIVLENSQQENYWTEKLADAFLSWCVPIYWGCPNIYDYFPNDSYYLLDINHPNPIEQINEIIKRPINIESLGKARNIILDKYNLWEVIYKKIKNINS